MGDTTAPDALVLEIRRLAAEVAALREEQAHLVRRQLEPCDRRTGAALLPLVFDLVAGAIFTAPGLMALVLNDRTPAGQALRELAGDYATESGGLRTFGRMLARLDGVPLAGLRLVRCGEAREGLRWRVARVSEP